ncbi:extracellular solute-binding protein, partial [Mitsuaria sp. TWR114]|uniref:extracellular solute-binding protein n=1 Tax=Mitsuaria sp. TWR114 TaxID=2601731 RepID=UPI0011BD6EB9
MVALTNRWISELARPARLPRLDFSQGLPDAERTLVVMPVLLIELKLLSMQYADHHLSMTTALATGSGLPDVMAIDLRYIGKFAGSGGFVDLNQAPYLAASHADDYVRFAMAQGAGPGGTQVAIPADIGPGTLIYRKDLLDRAGVSEAEITRDWSAYLSAGERLRKATGAYLMADAADLR